MTVAVWKYEVPVAETFSLEMPVGAVVLTVQLQRGKPQLWAKVNPYAPKECRTFVLLGTGHEIDMAHSGELKRSVAPSDEWIYCGTFQPTEALVFHVFDCSPKPQPNMRWESNEGSPGTLMPWKAFAEDVRDGMLFDDDGSGYLATATHNTPDHGISPSDMAEIVRPDWATHVLWFNR